MSAAEDVIALLAARITTPRIGKVAWREMDKDILAMRKAIELLEAPAAPMTEEQRIAFAEWLDDFHGKYITEGGCDFDPWQYQSLMFARNPGPNSQIIDPIIERARR